MTSIERVDKAIIFRSVDLANQITLNFRAERPGAYPADLMVHESRDCQMSTYTNEFEVLLPPHQLGETIHVRVRFVGQHLKVWVDQVVVLDRDFPFEVRSGRVGIGVIDAGHTTFDNVRIAGIR